MTIRLMLWAGSCLSTASASPQMMLSRGRTDMRSADEYSYSHANGSLRGYKEGEIASCHPAISPSFAGCQFLLG